MAAGDVTGHSTTAPSVCKGAVSLVSRKSVQSALCLGRADQAQKALSHQEFICNLVCITNELKGATSKHLKSLQSQKNDDPKKTRNPKILRKKYAKKKQKNSL